MSTPTTEFLEFPYFIKYNATFFSQGQRNIFISIREGVGAELTSVLKPWGGGSGGGLKRLFPLYCKS